MTGGIDRFQVSLAKYRLRQLSGQDFPEIAIHMLELGLDSPALRKLAASSPSDADIDDLVEKAATELSVSLNREQAAMVELRELLSGIIGSGQFDCGTAKRVSGVNWRSWIGCLKNGRLRADAESFLYFSEGLLEEVDEGFQSADTLDEGLYADAAILLNRVVRNLDRTHKCREQ